MSTGFQILSEKRTVSVFRKWSKGRQPDEQALRTAVRHRIESESAGLAIDVVARKGAARAMARIRAAAVESCLWEDFCAATGAKRQASGDWMLNPHNEK